MSPRSVYKGRYCLHCHKPVQDGRAVLASTYYIIPTRTTPIVRTQRQNYGLVGLDEDEIEMRVVYHRSCIEKILSHAPLEPEVEQANFDDYRNQLLVRFGMAEENEDP